MQISSTQAMQRSAYAQQQSDKPSFKPISPFTTTKSDTVTLTAEARKMYAPGSKVMMLGDEPVIVAPDETGNYPTKKELEESWNKIARIPQSATDLIPYATMVIDENSHTVDPGREAAYEDLTPPQRKGHEEYLRALSTNFSDELESRGITFMEYNAKRKVDSDFSNELDQSMRERLFSDPRIVELMQEFNVL